VRQKRSSKKGFGIGGPLRFFLSAFILTMLLLLTLSPCLAAAVNQPEAALNTAVSAATSPVSGDGTHYLGLLPTPEGDYPQIVLPQTLQSNLSVSADLSSQLPPVGDQGQQGSCVAWACSYYYKTWSEKQEHTSWDLNNPNYRFSPSFVYNQINGGRDNGSTFQNAFTLMQNTGDVDIAEMPYNQSNYTNKPSAAQLQAAKPYQIASGWAAFWVRGTNGPFSTANNIDTIKAWLASGQVLVMAIPVYKDFPDYGSNAAKTYYDYNGISGLAGGHGVCICGYDDNINPSGANADHKGGFKMVNSWGSAWNGSNAGYVYLSYDFVKRYVWEAWSMSDLSPDAPVISSLSATQANPGATIHIYGKNFGTKRRNARVSFNGVNATSASFTNADITAAVPTSATSGSLVVYDWDGAPSNAVAFTVNGTGPASPVVASVTPTSGAAGGVVALTVDGSNFRTGATVRLEQGTTVINGTGVNLVDGQIQASFDLTSAPAGAFDVVVRNTDGTEGRLASGFSVTAASNCGTGAGLPMVLFGLMGLLSLAGGGGAWKRRRKRTG
jgi:IPT/TIG domain